MSFQISLSLWMNVSLILLYLVTFPATKDFMPYIRSLLDGAPNTISGHLYVSVLGGNTANSEFEYLTGDSMAFLPSGSIPYQQYLNKYALSIVSHMKELGYSTTAMHPYNASGWKSKLCL